VVTAVVTVLLGVATVTVDDDADIDDVEIVVTCATLVEITGGAGSVSSQMVFLLPRRLRSLPLRKQ
jgi:hypothetical protein